jgi:hypothetical protein
MKNIEKNIEKAHKQKLSSMQACDKPNCFMRFVQEYCYKASMEKPDYPCPYEKMFSDMQYPLSCACECQQCKSYIESEEKLVLMLKNKEDKKVCPCDLEETIRQKVAVI